MNFSDTNQRTEVVGQNITLSKEIDRFRGIAKICLSKVEVPIRNIKY